DVVGERADLAVGVAAGDDDALEQVGHLAGVDHVDVAGFDVFEGVDDDFFQLGQFHGLSSKGGGGEYNGAGPAAIARRVLLRGRAADGAVRWPRPRTGPSGSGGA